MNYLKQLLKTIDTQPLFEEHKAIEPADQFSARAREFDEIAE
jgi:hypothetical protein